MSNIQSKEPASPSKKPSLFPVDMTWDHMDEIFTSLKSHWPFRMTEENLFETSGLNLSASMNVKEDKGR